MSADRTPSAGAFSITRASVTFIMAYAVVTVLASGLTITYQIVAQAPPGDLNESILLEPAFVATVPYHVLIMLVIWPAFAWAYFLKRRSQDRALEKRETLKLAVFWTVSAIVVDFVGFVLLKHAWALTPYEFYVLYQPWISLIYLAIFASPWIRFALARRRG